jgi:enoyl-CoA hydratase/carnithine racemase
VTQILHETRGPVSLVTLNRPERRNAWTRTLYAELVDAIQAANRRPGVGAIVITGAGRGRRAGVRGAAVRLTGARGSRILGVLRPAMGSRNSLMPGGPP